MNHASLFTGIGGFDLAAEWIGWTNLFQCEKDEWCMKLLSQNFQNTVKHGDIKTTDFSIYRGRVDVLTGGFPCQPYSTAGKRLGKDDERHLWPEMLRAIREIQPPWIVGENVRGLTNWNGGLVFDEVQSDLEAAGYEVTPFLLPACAVNAPHRRDRIWFIAYSASFRRQRQLFKREGVYRTDEACREAGSGSNEIATNTTNAGIESLRQTGADTVHESFVTANAHSNERPKGRIQQGHPSGAGADFSERRTQDPGGWEKFPTKPGICGRNDGIPNRVHRLKGLGNAVVPQVVLQLFKAIKSYEDATERTDSKA